MDQESIYAMAESIRRELYESVDRKVDAFIRSIENQSVFF